MSYAKLFAVWKHPKELYGAVVASRIDGEEYHTPTEKLIDWMRHYYTLLSSCGSRVEMKKYLTRDQLCGYFADEAAWKAAEAAWEAAAVVAAAADAEEWAEAYTQPRG